MLHFSASDKSEAGVPEPRAGDIWVRSPEMGSGRKDDLTPEVRKRRASSNDEAKKLKLIVCLGLFEYYSDFSIR